MNDSYARFAARSSVIGVARFAVLLVLLAAWQWIPQIPGIDSVSVIFDPFFISSPSQVGTQTWEFLTGSGETTAIWSRLLTTTAAALLGTAIGTILGATLGVILSAYDTLSRVFSPFIVAVNAIPRIAIIPIVIIVFGSGLSGSTISAVLLVVFIVFYNAWEGGRSVPREMVQNAGILGASRTGTMWRIRMPVVMAWVFAVLPTALTFGLIGVVTTELLSGSQGMGGLLTLAMYRADATTTFSIVVLLSVLGVVLVMVVSALRSRVLHWWDAGGAVGLN